MKKGLFVIRSGVCVILSMCLFGCGNLKEPDETGTVVADSSSAAKVVSVSAAGSDSSSNMVDERFELLSLVFRLAGRQEYGDTDTQYQQALVTEFGRYQDHEAVQYAGGLPLGYDAVFSFAVHIQKNGDRFAFIDDIGSLVEDGRWTRESAAEFLKLLNGFYTETGFASFYQSNLDFYRAQTQLFIDSTYSDIDLAWFGTYVDPGNLRCIYAPSSTRNNYSATVNGQIVYCAVSGDGSVIVHEYCHSFANPVAHKWYEENPEFKKWCDDTVDLERLPSYGTGRIIAGEYVTRAYNTLYYAEHGYALTPLLYVEKGQGFPYMEEVYGMITPYEKPELGEDKIKGILGVSYDLGEEQSFSVGDRELRWRLVTLSGPLPSVYLQTEVGNVFGSDTGDVLYVEDTGEDHPYLLIDLGETTFQGRDGFRGYSRLPVE